MQDFRQLVKFCPRRLTIAIATCALGTTVPGADLNPAQRLLEALDASQAAQAILRVEAETREFREGKEYSRASIVAQLPLDGSESRVVLAHTPFTKVNDGLNWESNRRTTFNGRYWASAIYDFGNVGDLPSAVRELRITAKMAPHFNGYRRDTALQLGLPFVRFQNPGGWMSLRQLLEGRTDWAWTVTEEKHGDKSLLKFALPPSEWLLIDPERNFVVLEHVNQAEDWREETRAREVRLTSCGLWFATDCVFVHTIRGQEHQRTETRVVDVTLADKADFEKELVPSYGRGWKVKDERTQKEHLIEGGIRRVFFSRLTLWTPDRRQIDP